MIKVHTVIHDVRHARLRLHQLSKETSMTGRDLSWITLEVEDSNGECHSITLFGPNDKPPPFVVSPPLKCDEGGNLVEDPSEKPIAG